MEITNTADITAIQELIKALMDGFAQADPEAFASVFQNDGECILRDGQYLKGRQEITETHRRIFAGIYQEGTSSDYLTEDVRFPEPAIAIARIKGHMIFSQGEKIAEVNGRISLVCVKHPENDWQVTLFQNTSVVS
jgi:uncharacterized protein (TIGR02246 family)